MKQQEAHISIVHFSNIDVQGYQVFVGMCHVLVKVEQSQNKLKSRLRPKV